MITANNIGGGGMKCHWGTIGRKWLGKTRSTWTKPIPVPRCTTHIQHGHLTGVHNFYSNTLEYDVQVYLTKWKVKWSTVTSAACTWNKRTRKPTPPGYARIPAENVFFLSTHFKTFETPLVTSAAEDHRFAIAIMKKRTSIPRYAAMFRL
jgi:hypothetical protein